ncbi:MAG: hypothetical protein KR126chlam1_01416 [Chlamydiae bacterium]|nr:hypothetical protein [Chlamydiota bacterium]
MIHILLTTLTLLTLSKGITMPANDLSPEVKTKRQATYPINSLILNRWSPRSMSGESMSDEELLPLFEAARWAPSSFNDQPWVILYAKRGTPEWNLFFDLLVEPNKTWVKNASAILVVTSRETFERNGNPSATHSYDTGASWMAMALEGSSRGYVVHGMSGFDYKKARTVLEIPEGYTVEAMAAIGKPAPKEQLPEGLQKIEAPSGRKPLNKVAVHGKFPKK